jgi:hypothetical protein
VWKLIELSCGGRIFQLWPVTWVDNYFFKGDFSVMKHHAERVSPAVEWEVGYFNIAL